MKHKISEADKNFLMLELKCPRMKKKKKKGRKKKKASSSHALARTGQIQSGQLQPHKSSQKAFTTRIDVCLCLSMTGGLLCVCAEGGARCSQKT